MVPRTAPDVAHATPDVVRAAGRFPRASNVQHLIYFWNIQIQLLQHKKKIDETLKTNETLKHLWKTPKNN
jgi:hypothetical protein